jgi:molybdate transport system regulatory protein
MKDEPYKVEAAVTIYHQGDVFIGPQQFALIRQLIEDGSMNAAAHRLGYSFQKTWQMVHKMNELAPEPIVISQLGGRHGGGCVVSDYGKRLIKSYAQRELEVLKVLAQNENELDNCSF